MTKAWTKEQFMALAANTATMDLCFIGLRVALIEKNDLSEDWCPWIFEAIGNGMMMTGAEVTARYTKGPRKGELNCRKPNTPVEQFVLLSNPAQTKRLDELNAWRDEVLKQREREEEPAT